MVQLTKWISFAETYPVDSEACLKVLNELNGELVQKTVLAGGGTKTSEVDDIIYSVVQSSVVCIIHILLLQLMYSKGS